MKTLVRSIGWHANLAPERCALLGDRGGVRYAELPEQIRCCSEALPGQVVGLLMENGPAWMIADLALGCSGRTCVPLPPFFSRRQLGHVLEDAGVDCVVTDRPREIGNLLPEARQSRLRIGDETLYCFRRTLPVRPDLEGVAKLTYTSGTTGTPKGVCLENETMMRVVESLRWAVGAREGDRFLSLLPLATLLENLALYVSLSVGGMACLPRLSDPGLSMTGMSARALTGLIERSRPNFLVLVPQLLRLLVSAVESGWPTPPSLRFIAVGGAAVSQRLLERALALGLPVYEGYGLSEAASVVCLNRPGARRVGSVGRPLPHAEVRIADDGEVLVRGGLFRGYLGQRPHGKAWWPTGDLGYLDDQGYLYLNGRKQDRFTTAFGRNISPEWVERELTVSPAIRQACVHGEGRPFVSALIVPAPTATLHAVEQAVAEANARLPEYAAVRRFVIRSRPFSLVEGELTPNGRLRRRVILARHAEDFERIYEENEDAVL